MTPALMKVNLFNLLNELHPVTSTVQLNAASVSMDGLHSHHRQTLASCCQEEHCCVIKGGSPYPDPSEWSWLRKTWVLGAGRKGPGCFSCCTRVQSPGTNRDFTDEAPSWHHDMTIMSQPCYPGVNNTCKFIRSRTYKSITRFTKFKERMTPSVSRGAEFNVSSLSGYTELIG